MNETEIQCRQTRDLPRDAVLDLYRANGWSAAGKPDLLLSALKDSHSVVSAWDGARLVGLGNAISDGHMVVYYPHLLVLPTFQRRGIGREIMRRLMANYAGLHQHVLIADARAAGFYRKLGFSRAGETQPLWIYGGREH